MRGTRAITADTALRLSRYFGTSERFWLNLQGRFELEIEKEKLGKRLEREVCVWNPTDAANGTSGKGQRVAERRT